MANYIILRNSVEQAAHVADPGTHHGKKFLVVHDGGFRPNNRKTGSAVETIGGYIDVSVGPIFFEWSGVIRTADTLDATAIANGYGSLGDLRTYFLLNNPSASPSNLITLVDHKDTEHTGLLMGDFSEPPLTPYVTGVFAHYFIPVHFVQRQAVA